MKEFIEYAVRELVDFPNEVDVRQVDGDKTTIFELRLNKTDLGKVIGKRGRTIQALRTLVNGAGHPFAHVAQALQAIMSLRSVGGKALVSCLVSDFTLAMPPPTTEPTASAPLLM